MFSMRELERILKVLGNRRRLSIVRHLSKVKEASVGQIAGVIKLSMHATSRHLSNLYSVNILEKEQRGLEVWYRLADDAHTHPITKLVANLVK